MLHHFCIQQPHDRFRHLSEFARQIKEVASPLVFFKWKPKASKKEKARTREREEDDPHYMSAMGWQNVFFCSGTESKLCLTADSAEWLITSKHYEITIEDVVFIHFCHCDWNQNVKRGQPQRLTIAPKVWVCSHVDIFMQKAGVIFKLEFDFDHFLLNTLEPPAGQVVKTCLLRRHVPFTANSLVASLM